MPDITDFDRYRVTNPNVSEQYADCLYDSALYPTAGSPQLAFFQTGIAQGVTSSPGATVGAVKSASDTNMQTGGTLSNGLNFLVEGIEVLFMPGLSAAANTYTLATLAVFNTTAALTVFNSPNDVNAFYQSGVLELNILQRNYVRRAPLLAFPPRTHFAVDGALASNAAATAISGLILTRATGLPFYVDPPITIPSTMAFEVLLKWPGGVVATPSGFNGRVVVSMPGKTMRVSQ